MKTMIHTSQDRGDSLDVFELAHEAGITMHRFTAAPQGTLHTMMGIPGSGKSTVAEDIKQMHNAVRISPDEIRRMLTGDPNDQTRNDEVFGIAHQSTRGNLSQGNHVIFDATNVKADQRAPLLRIADQTGARKHLHVVNLDWKWQASATVTGPKEWYLRKFWTGCTRRC